MKKLRSLTALFMVGVVLALSLAAHHLTRGQPDVAAWPTPEARQSAVEIPLSRAWAILVTPEGASHAAVIGDMLYLEMIPEAFEGGGSGGVADGSGVRKARMPFPAASTVARLAEVSAVDLTVNTGRESVSTFERVLQFTPILLLLGLMAFFLLRGATGSLGLSKSFDVIEPARLREGFSDVAGIDAARSEIVEIVDFLKDPVSASRLGGRMPKGVLFDGPPGSGKTLLARAMAREAGVPFITIDAAGMNQIFVGAGAMKIRKVFKEARKRAPCIVFIDEIDSMGRARGAGGRGGAGDEKETTLNALLVELDGFGPREGIVVIAATNRPEILDSALTRRGRIDRRITVSLPDIEGRKAILTVHARKVETAPDIDLAGIAATTFGFSGADLAALVNEAALHATRMGHAAVGMEDFAAARDRMVVGMSGSNRKMDAEDLKLTAVHEAGHAMIAALEPDADPIEKVTILPQGRAAGFVMQAPDRDRIFETRGRLQARIRVAVAGRIAEEAIFGPDAVTSGAVSDIEQATRIAREMVVNLGMSSLGFIRLDQSDTALHDFENPPVREIRRIIEQAEAHVSRILAGRREDLLRLSQELMRREVMDGADVARILGLEGEIPGGRQAA